MQRVKEWIDGSVDLSDCGERRYERMNAASHGIGLITAAAAAVMMIRRAAGTAAIQAAWVYGASLCTLFAASTVYHTLPVCTAKRFFRIIDHITIYILIAGTYTPYAAAMAGPAGSRLLLIIWNLALLGILLKIVFWKRLKIFHLVYYLFMGWLIVFFRDAVAGSAPRGQLLWMAAGGSLYSLGTMFYALGRRRPALHTIWHIFVLGGAAGLHVGICRYALPGITG